MFLFDDKEPFTRGHPEIVVKTMFNAFNLSGTGDTLTLGCMCDKLSECGVVNIDFWEDVQPVENATWKGDGLVAFLDDLALPNPDNLTSIFVYENDNDPQCEYRPENNPLQDIRVQLSNARGNNRLAAMQRVNSPSSPQGWAVAAGSVVGVLGLFVFFESSGDDLIGVVDLPATASGFAQPRDITFFPNSITSTHMGTATFELRQQ